ncbi:MAG TPA: hypothetical protein VFE78_31125 [Gemmataceae bacterium]|nr:hypothetical protein [Gemmataceae bacterium]
MKRTWTCLAGVFGGSVAALALAANFLPGAPPLDRPKAKIESPAKRVLARSANSPAAPADFVNPKVEPGKVRWHADFDTACRAAGRSGKPVLLFHMMGRLDEKFC